MLESIYCFSSYVVVSEFLSLQTCINSWAESLGTPSHLCPWGPGGGAGGGGDRLLARGPPVLKACLPGSGQGLFAAVPGGWKLRVGEWGGKASSASLHLL